MTETLAHGYSSESPQWELSKEYRHNRVQMFFKDLCILVFWSQSLGRVKSIIHFINYYLCMIMGVLWRYVLPTNIRQPKFSWFPILGAHKILAKTLCVTVCVCPMCQCSIWRHVELSILIRGQVGSAQFILRNGNLSNDVFMAVIRLSP